MQHRLCAAALLSAVVLGQPAAAAATTSASASAFVSGTTVSQSTTGGPEGVQASAEQVIPSASGDVFVSAAAVSAPGSLHAEGTARTSGTPGGFEGQASAQWGDSFVILASSHTVGTTGIFSGSANVTGSLIAEFFGRAYADAQIYATVDIFPGTGFNGGRTLISGSARRLAGYDIAGGSTGTDTFTLKFTDVPFTFGQAIDVSMALSVFASLNVVDPGGGGRTQADYGHTVTWGGLSEVRDELGNQITDFSALSGSSGFDFAHATPAVSNVPEPGVFALMLAGLAAGIQVARRRKRSNESGIFLSLPECGAAMSRGCA